MAKVKTQQLMLFPERSFMSGVPRRGRPARRVQQPADDGRGRHENSLAARVDHQQAFTGRRLEVLTWLKKHGPATDREIVAGLFFDGADMNLVRPRVTELLDARAVAEVEQVCDAVTGMMVRRVAVTGGGA